MDLPSQKSTFQNEYSKTTTFQDGDLPIYLLSERETFQIVKFPKGRNSKRNIPKRHTTVHSHSFLVFGSSNGGLSSILLSCMLFPRFLLFLLYSHIEDLIRYAPFSSFSSVPFTTSLRSCTPRSVPNIL